MHYHHLVVYIGIALCTGASSGLAGTCQESGLARYIAGIELLNNASSLSPSEKTACYRRLVALTGVDAQCAETLIRGYHDRPEQWQKIQKSVLATIEQPDTLKKE
jgi:hypothetical protein